MQTPQTKRKRSSLTPVQDIKEVPDLYDDFRTPNKSWNISSGILSHRKKIFAEKSYKTRKRSHRFSYKQYKRDSLHKYHESKLSIVKHKQDFSAHKNNLFLRHSLTKSESVAKEGSMNSKDKVINEILLSDKYLFILFYSGDLLLVDKHTLKKIKYLNKKPGEVIRSIYLNKLTNTLIIINVYEEEKFLKLHIKELNLLLIDRDFQSINTIFLGEDFVYPGFIEFDEVNSKIITYNSTNKVYKIWCLRNYKLLYSLTNRDIREIKVTTNYLLLLFEESIEVLDISTGVGLTRFMFAIKKNDFELIDIINEWLLLKEKGRNLKITNVLTNKSNYIKNTSNINIKSLIILSLQNILLYINENVFKIYNLNFKNSDVIQLSSLSNIISFSNNQNLMFVINDKQMVVYNIVNKKRINKISKFQIGISHEQVKKLENAFTKVSNITYDEIDNCIFTTNNEGQVFRWSL